MKYIRRKNKYGKIRYFPLTKDEQFNLWNEFGYKKYHNMFGGYIAYIRWIKKIDDKTLEQMENDNVI